MELSVLCKVLVRHRIVRLPFRALHSKTLLIMTPSAARSHRTSAKMIINAMKLTSFLLLVTSLHLGARGISQQVTLKGQDLPMEQIFRAISKQTGYMFLYEQNVLQQAKKVDLNLLNVSVEKALKECFRNQPLEYSIMRNNVLVKVRRAVVSAPDLIFQNIPVVSGKVSNEKGEALEGVAVQVKGTGKGTQTNRLGMYFLANVDKEAMLIFTMVGYKRQEVPVAGRASISLGMQLAVADLETVDVSVITTGYKQIPKHQLTGAASVVTQKEYDQRVAVTGNFLESLEGKVPGLVYNGQTGELTIRGVSTFDAVKQPLIVLDGFPTEIDLRTINPIDIVSVSVLRDAAAASIYGVRASNGVIVVETRRGKSGKPVFNLRGTYAVQNKPDFNYLKYAPANEFVQLQKDYFSIAQTSFTLYQLGFYKMDPVQEILFGKTQLSVSNPLLTEDQANQKLAALGSYDNLKEYESLFYQNRLAQNINFDVSGGSDRNTYVLGINYVGETPVNRKSENRQIILNIANTFKLSGRFKLDFKGNYTNSSDKSGKTPVYSDFYPYEHLADANGNALPVALDPGRDYISRVISKTTNANLMAAGLYDQFYYPYRELTSNRNTNKGSSTRFQARLNAKITNWMNIDLGGNYENQNMLLEQLQLQDAYLPRVLISTMALKEAVTGRALFTNLPQGDILGRTNQRVTNYTARAQLNIGHKFNGDMHDISGIFGIERKRTLSREYKTSYFGYDGQTLISKPINMSVLNSTSSPAFSELGITGTRFRSTDYFYEKEGDRRFMSYYGQGTYVFNKKYVATGSFRIDQSNLFGVDPKYKNKPLWSAGVNWRLGEEEFMKNVNWISDVQIRAATGFNGNVPSSNNGAFLILSTALNTTLANPLAYNTVATPENQSLRWETTRNYNLGMDYTIVNNRISGSIDWYMKRTSDVFGQFDADPTSGFNAYSANTASIQNSGLEFLVNSLNIKRPKFEWRTQLTASLNHNKVLSVKATEYANSQLIANGTNLVSGLPIGALYSYNYGGLNAMGQPFVYDNKGNQKVLAFFGTALVDVTKDDMIYNGTTTPKYVLGLNNQIGIGSFDISFLFMYYGGHVMRVEQPNPNNIGFLVNNPLQGASNFWRKAGDEKTTRIPGYVRASSLAPGYYQSYALYGYQYASEFVRKADYIRLRDVVITYNAKGRFIEKTGLKNTQLRFQAQNFFRYTFSGNDIDPDAINRITGVRTLETQPFYSLTFSTNF